jgi:predicted nucleotidyltransferase
MRHSEVLQELKRRLLAEFGEEVTRVLVYGSVARGEDTQDSDIDVMVVFKEEQDLSRQWHRARHIANELGFDHDELICVLATSEEDYRTLVTPLLMNVRREAVPL